MICRLTRLQLHATCLLELYAYMCVRVRALRPACRPPCCRVAAGPGRQGRWWTETDSAAADGSAARECTPTPAEKKTEFIPFFFNLFCVYLAGFRELTSSSAALGLWS